MCIFYSCSIYLDKHGWCCLVVPTPRYFLAVSCDMCVLKLNSFATCFNKIPSTYDVKKKRTVVISHCMKIKTYLETVLPKYLSKCWYTHFPSWSRSAVMSKSSPLSSVLRVSSKTRTKSIFLTPSLKKVVGSSLPTQTSRLTPKPPPLLWSRT